MCLLQQPSAAAPKLQQPTEYAQQRAPDAAGSRSSTSQRTLDRMRAGNETILTSGSGVSQTADTSKKTLLGQ